MTAKLRLADRVNDLLPILGFGAAIASLTMPLNPFLVGVILAGSVIAAVHHAEVVAHRVGEPFGTLILALAVTVIEVGLILTLMQAEPEKAATLARDTVFAAVMIILNGIVGICLLAGGVEFREQSFTQTGVSAALNVLVAMSVLTLVLPNFVESAPGPVYAEPVPPPYRGPVYATPDADAIAYCSRRFRTYDPETGTYIGTGGVVRACP